MKLRKEAIKNVITIKNILNNQVIQNTKPSAIQKITLIT